MSISVKLYGIPNCNTVKKARDWLDSHEISYEFHDFKKQGISEELINNWLKSTDLDSLINKKGTTWRLLTDQEKNKATNLKGSVALMLEKPSVIKRPILIFKKNLLLGFNVEAYENIFANT